jgi:hypothetical protein
VACLRWALPLALEQETPIRRSVAVLIAVVAVVAVAVPALAAGLSVDVPSKFKPLLPKVKKKSGLAVRLPQTLHAHTKLYPAATATKTRYDLELSAARNCGFATACFVASFSGERGGVPGFKRTVSLTRGITGYFKPVTCGASCSPAFIQWKENGVLYEIENRDSGKHEQRNMVKLANSAIRGGAR